MVKKKYKSSKPCIGRLYLFGGDTEDPNVENTGTNDGASENSIDNGQKSGGSSGGGSFMSNASQILGFASMFDSIAQAATASIDASRSGVSGNPQVLVEGVLGGQSGSHLGNMWNTKAKTREAINYVNNLDDTQFAVNNSDNLLAQHAAVKKLDEMNINTKGKEFEDFAFDPASYLLTKAFGLRESAAKRQERINRAISAANARQEVNYQSAVDAFKKNQTRNVLANYRAFGGPMFGYFGDGAIAYDMAKDNFIAKMKATESKKPITSDVNALAEGGQLSDNFTNGVTMVGTGGTHEQNPNMGVPMGMAPDGMPNLVEEGEVIYDDYVFSNRLKVPKAVRNKYKLRGPKDMTFAEAFENAQKESQERENDPISKNGLDSIAMVLAQTQEAVRAKNASHKKAKGGHLFADGSWWNKPQDVVEEEVFEPEVDNLIDKFWSSRLGPYSKDAGIRDLYLQEHDPYYTSNNKDKKKSGSSSGSRINPLRLADVIAGGYAVLGDTLGLTNNPYTYDFIPDYAPIGFSPLGDYVPELKVDTRYAANQQAQQAAATRAAILNTTSPNKYANLLAADYNAQNIYGDLLRNAELANYDNLIKARTFNRATNQTNTEEGLKAAIEDSKERLAYGQAKLMQAKYNVDETNATSGAKARNIGNFARSISGIGTEEDALAWRDMLLRSGVYGTLSEKPRDWSPEEWDRYRYNLVKNRTAANGGKLKKKRRGFTY